MLTATFFTNVSRSATVVSSWKETVFSFQSCTTLRKTLAPLAAWMFDTETFKAWFVAVSEKKMSTTEAFELASAIINVCGNTAAILPLVQ